MCNDRFDPDEGDKAHVSHVGINMLEISALALASAKYQKLSVGSGLGSKALRF